MLGVGFGLGLVSLEQRTHELDKVTYLELLYVEALVILQGVQVADHAGLEEADSSRELHLVLLQAEELLLARLVKNETHAFQGLLDFATERIRFKPFIF